MFRLVRALLLLAVCASASAQVPSPIVATPSGPAAGSLPPVETFFKRPKYDRLTLSPDGKLLAALVPFHERRNLALIDLEKGTVVALTALTQQDVYDYRWIGDRLIEVRTANLADAAGLVVLKQDVLIDMTGKVVRDMLTSGRRGPSRILMALDRAGDNLIVSNRDRTAKAIDAYSYEPRTGEKALLTSESPGDVVELVPDRKGDIRVAVSVPRGATRSLLWYRASNESQWIKLRDDPIEDAPIEPIAFDFDNKTLYVYSHSKQNDGRKGIYAFDPATNQLGKLLFQSDSFDAGPLVFDWVRKQPVGVQNDTLGAIEWIDGDWKMLQKSIDAALPDARNQLSWGRYDTNRVIVRSEAEARPPVYFLMDRKTGRLEEVASAYPWLTKGILSPRKLVRYPARDGLSIPAHLTMPKGADGTKVPLIVNIHGGPFVPGGRFGYNAEAEFFASRGYAVLEPDFRGTRGYGDVFYKAGWRQWGLAMQDDVTDGVKWLIDSGKVDADRVCLFGGSYGGYATLWGLEKEPQMFRCGVALVAVSDLEMMFDVSWSDFIRAERGGDTTNVLARWIGDPDRDREKMRAVSPLYHADRIQAPLLLAYGAADERVPLIHGTRMRAALDKYNKPYEWVVYDDEGHGFNKDENRYDFYRRVDAFLSKNLAPRHPAPAAAVPTAPLPAVSTASSPR